MFPLNPCTLSYSCHIGSLLKGFWRPRWLLRAKSNQALYKAGHGIKLILWNKLLSWSTLTGLRGLPVFFHFFSENFMSIISHFKKKKKTMEPQKTSNSSNIVKYIQALSWESMSYLTSCLFPNVFICSLQLNIMFNPKN